MNMITSEFFAGWIDQFNTTAATLTAISFAKAYQAKTIAAAALAKGLQAKVLVGLSIFGGRKKKQRYLRHDGKEHVLAFAPTRSGKGVGLVIPTLLSWLYSCVIHDIKGENWAVTSGWRKSIGHRVIKFCPVEMNNIIDRFTAEGMKKVEQPESKEIRQLEWRKALVLAKEITGSDAPESEKKLLALSLIRMAYAGYDPRHDKAAVAFAYGAAPTEVVADRSNAGLWAFLARTPEQIFDDLLNTAYDISGCLPKDDAKRKALLKTHKPCLDVHPVVKKVAEDLMNELGDQASVKRCLSNAIGALAKYREKNRSIGARFNPLEEVRWGTDHEVKDVQNLATMIVDPDGKGLNDHWAKTGFSLIVGIILHVHYSKEEIDKTLRGVIGFLSNPGWKTPTQIYETMKNAEHDSSGIMSWRDAEGNLTKTHPVVSASAQDMLSKSDNERSGVLSTAMSFLSIYRDPLVAANTEVSDFKIIDLVDADRPVSLYLVVPPSDKDRLKPLIRLIINQIVRQLTESMAFEGGTQADIYKHRLLLLLDEFPSLGKLDIFAESLAYLAGYNIKVYLICQDVTQLYASYTKDESIISNCHIRIAYAPNKMETAELLSKMTGESTVTHEQKNFSGNRLALMQNNVSISEQHTGRPLLTAHECTTLPPDDMLIFVAGSHAIRGKKIKFYEDKTFLARSKIPAPTVSDRIRKPGEVKPWDGGQDGMVKIARRQDAVTITFGPMPTARAEKPAANPNSQQKRAATGKQEATAGEGRPAEESSAAKVELMNFLDSVVPPEQATTESIGSPAPEAAPAVTASPEAQQGTPNDGLEGEGLASGTKDALAKLNKKFGKPKIDMGFDASKI